MQVVKRAAACFGFILGFDWPDFDNKIVELANGNVYIPRLVSI